MSMFFLRDSQDAAGRRRRWISADVFVRVCWFLNVALLAGLCLWVLLDGRLPRTVHALQTQLSAAIGRSAAPSGNWSLLAGRLLTLKVVAAGSITSGLGIFIGLFAGARRHRRVRSWLSFTAVAAGWLTLFVSWPEMAWQGQCWRLKNDIAGLETLAAPLRAAWPQEDGEREGLGPFMAYPVGDPSILLLLTTPTVPGGDVPVAAVEQSSDGALRFQLTGAELGAWMEWHPPGGAPASFVGGLMTRYDLNRFAPLGRGWFLARYHESAAADEPPRSF